MAIRSLSDREHILLRPSMYIGAVNSTLSYEYVFDSNKIVHKEVSYVPGLIKIINEIIDNSVDVAIKTNFEHANQISISVSNEYVEVKDNGTGIPVVKNSDGDFLPMICWNRARAGSNFDDDSNRTQIGMNGVGSFATNCFSKKFVGYSDDGVQSYKIEFINNAESFKESIGKTKNSTGVTVKFWPDLEKFGLNEIDDTHQSIIQQRLINLSMSFPKITFKFNGKKINASSFKKYVTLFNENFEIFESDNYRFAILPNHEDDFRQFSYVNGLKIPDGGTHIDIITDKIVSGLRERLQRKYKEIKPGDIKNKLMIVAFLTDLKNPKFNSQSKEKITNSVPEINSYFGDIPFEQIIKSAFKNSAIIDPITEVYRIKEEFKRRQELKSLDKPVKKIKSDKYLPPIGVKKYLFLVEGQCLHEDTGVLMSDFSVKKIKDVEIGDEVISGDLSKQTIIAQTKLLKRSLTFVTPSGKITCGYNHKLKVYDQFSHSFIFLEAHKINEDIGRYKFVKCKFNKDTHALCVKKNNLENKVLELDHGVISYTTDDVFIILRDGIIMRMHSLEIIPEDLIILG